MNADRCLAAGLVEESHDILRAVLFMGVSTLFVQGYRVAATRTSPKIRLNMIAGVVVVWISCALNVVLFVV